MMPQSTPRVVPVSPERPPLENTLGVILAAGLGKRMKTSLPKVAHSLLGKPLVLWAIDALREAGVVDITVVLSPAQTVVAEKVRAYVANLSAMVGEDRAEAGACVRIAWQTEAKGTGHAALCGLRGALEANPSLVERLAELDVLVGFGDTPAVRGETFARYLASHRAEKNKVTVFAFEPENPRGYGRVLTNEQGAFIAIREEKDCTSKECEVRLSNSGFLCARGDVLHDVLPRLGNGNAAGEYYLTDVPALVLSGQEGRVGLFKGADEKELAGVNSQEQLAAMAEYVQARVLQGWMEKGVQFLAPKSTYVEPTVTFDADVVVEPFTYLAGNTHVPQGTRVKAGTRWEGNT
ncbi:MAG: NTP transferase domain-containing protein [Silvanigrellales bacterium]|nr:NTP transferase domain-containing protein [Silvanigrellales bacterium]